VQSYNKMAAFRSGDSTQMHDPQYVIYASLLHVPIGVTVSKGGDIVKVDSIEGIVDKIIASDAHKDSLPPGIREQMLAQISDGGVKAIVQHVFSHFGSDPVVKNATWTSVFQSMADVFPTENVITYTLSDLSNSGAGRSATFQSDLKVKVMRTHIDDSTASISYKGGKFVGTATTQVDLVRGITIRKSARMEVSMGVSAVGRGAFSNNVGEIKKTTVRETILERL